MYKSVITAGASTAALLALSVAVFAQTPGQAQPPRQEPTAQAPARQVTITGCVQSEADYRQAKNLGRGGAAATGVGVGNEFVITNAAMSSASAKGAGEAPAGTAGTAGDAYEVTGSSESQLKQHAGKRVEITGTVKPAEKAAGKPTGGADPLGQDLRLPELEVSTVKPATGDCPTR